MAGESRREIHPGLEVEIVQKADQRTGRRTSRFIQSLDSRSASTTIGGSVSILTRWIGTVWTCTRPIGRLPSPLDFPAMASSSAAYARWGKKGYNIAE